MNYMYQKITLDEVPGYLMCCLSITGCALRCKGCHSPELWSHKNGVELNINFYDELYAKYGKDIDGICFMGGEWDKDIIRHIQKVKKLGWLVGFYTGLEWEVINEDLKNEVDFLKCGAYEKELGGLEDATTNQMLIEMKTKKIILGKNKGAYYVC